MCTYIRRTAGVRRARNMACNYYQQVKAAGGAEYEALKLRMRERKRRSRARAGMSKYYKQTLRGRQHQLLQNARKRARASGLEFSITRDDLYWPTHCPVFGIELNYLGGFSSDRHREFVGQCASLDRWDNSKGYVPGNVYVISYKANALKGNATPAEMAAIYAYMTYDPLADVRW